jgi:hypothetical protein
MQILFLNHKIEKCGVYQYGRRVYDILKKTEDIEYIYKEVDCLQEYHECLNLHPSLNYIIYNYHCSTMSWLTNDNIQKKIKNIGIPHESPEYLFDIICNIDPNAVEIENNYSLPRPIYENVDEIIQNYQFTNPEIIDFITKYTDTDLPIFGSFGFGFENKGFDKIVKMVNEQYDKAIIKLVIPIAHFDPYPMINQIRESCMSQNLKSGIKLMISHDFFSNEEILYFLKSNTMNLFLYDEMIGRGISSTIDYAISVKRPFGISNSYMFRNIYSDQICVYKNSIQYCMNNSIDLIDNLLKKYSNENMINKFKKIIEL